MLQYLSIYIFVAASSDATEMKRILFFKSKDEQNIERMEQGETIPLAMSPLPQSSPTPSSSWEPYSLPVLYHNSSTDAIGCKL
mmetsp:Transcript_16048/g.39307  ORF Transcript_16048/g.39307 Transcript_16048/m.39307 type:complete len:83 (+) Transcript_16048:767-1015(+)